MFFCRWAECVCGEGVGVLGRVNSQPCSLPFYHQLTLQTALRKSVSSPAAFSPPTCSPPISISPRPLTHFYYCHRSLSLASSSPPSVCLWAVLYWERLAGRPRGREGGQSAERAKKRAIVMERQWLTSHTKLERRWWYHAHYTTILCVLYLIDLKIAASKWSYWYSGLQQAIASVQSGCGSRTLLAWSCYEHCQSCVQCLYRKCHGHKRFPPFLFALLERKCMWTHTHTFIFFVNHLPCQTFF